MTKTKKQYWLMKTEPDLFSFEKLVNSPKKTACWDGVRNYQARNFMRDQFQIGDEVFVYHSGQEDPAIMGTAEVVKTGYPDPSALDPKSPYFDEKSKKDGASRWVMVDIKATAKLAKPVTISDVRATKGLATMALIKRGQRLSIQPLEKAHWDLILKLGKPSPV